MFFRIYILSGLILLSSTLGSIGCKADVKESVVCKAMLYYNGEQDITCQKASDGSYMLRDADRGIYTYDGSYNTVMANGFQTTYNPAATDLASELLRTYKLCGGDFTNASADWTGHTLKNRIDSISVTYPIVTSANPYYFALIVDASASNAIVMATDTVDCYNRDNRQRPAVFHLPEALYQSPSQNYYLEVYAMSKSKSKKSRMARTALYDASATEEYTNSGSSFGILYRTMEDWQPALDAHWGVEKAYDYYLERYGIKSFDNNGTPIHLFINPSTQNYSEMYSSNAAAFVIPGGEGFMVFGMGEASTTFKSKSSKPYVFIDVLAHEYTHLVVNRLSHTGETGALNESYADIMSKNIQLYATGKTDWQTGAEGSYTGSVVRSFDEPSTHNAPECYGDSHWMDPTITGGDQGGVHTNCSVQNHWYYLLCMGGRGVNTLGKEYSVEKISRRDAEDIVFHAFYDYSFDGMTYIDARDNAIKAAVSLFGENSQQVSSVTDAWDAVGVGESSTGIIQIEYANTKNCPCYNIAGQRISGNSHGIFIQNGKKIIK